MRNSIFHVISPFIGRYLSIVREVHLFLEVEVLRQVLSLCQLHLFFVHCPEASSSLLLAPGHARG